ncbi:SPARC-related modular calcium-binding protein 1 [Varanus komodoensis]|nr:SPARC-related modular calcium-binding protein 1 [Varanus komodoensis]
MKRAHTLRFRASVSQLVLQPPLLLKPFLDRVAIAAGMSCEHALLATWTPVVLLAKQGSNPSSPPIIAHLQGRDGLVSLVLCRLLGETLAEERQWLAELIDRCDLIRQLRFPLLGTSSFNAHLPVCSSSSRRATRESPRARWSVRRSVAAPSAPLTGSSINRCAPSRKRDAATLPSKSCHASAAVGLPTGNQTVDTNLTRCLEDRAAALSQSRRQMHATYIPECAEDGTFLQVQCHKQTGYCWCSSPEGKPISGTSVLNETPNCTGSYTVRTSWQDPNSSRRVDDAKTFVIVAFDLFSSLNAEEGTRPRPTQSSPLPHKQEGGTSLPFLMPIIIPDFKPNQTVKQAQEYPPSCEQERREAIDEARQHQQEGTFIPECEGDGTYKAVQCHQATGYCWCVRVDTGRPVPGTSTRSFPPDCEADEATKSAELASLFRDRTLPGCPGAKKAEFLSSLIKALASDMLQSRMMPIPYQRFPDSLVGPSLEERAVRWQFVRLDKDFSNSISERELRPLKLYMKKNTRPKRCVRKFLDYCDLNENKLISLHELKGCLGLS